MNIAGAESLLVPKIQRQYDIASIVLIQIASHDSSPKMYHSDGCLHKTLFLTANGK